jgi:hypothetical protein
MYPPAIVPFTVEDVRATLPVSHGLEFAQDTIPKPRISPWSDREDLTELCGKVFEEQLEGGPESFEPVARRRFSYRVRIFERVGDSGHQSSHSSV